MKADHLCSAGPLQHLSITAWKLEDINMDFIVGLSPTARKHDSIWVIVDKLTKSTHFIPGNTHYLGKKYVELYIARVVYLHGVLKTTTPDRGAQFVS